MSYKTGKRERTNFLDDRGVAVDGYRVYFTMNDGTVDYVEVEKTQYNAVNVKAAIEEAILQHVEVAGA